MARRRSPLHAVEEAIAALHEEINFTLNFARAMVREQNYRAAADAIDQQRLSLLRASRSIERALSAPEVERRRLRARVTAIGLAATLVLASGAYAALGPMREPRAPDTKVEAIEQASEALTRASEISDPLELQAVMGGAQDTVLEVAQATPAAPTDPKVARSLLKFIRAQRSLLRRNPYIPAQVRERAQEVAETVEQIVVEAPVVPIEEEDPAATDTAEPQADPTG